MIGTLRVGNFCEQLVRSSKLLREQQIALGNQENSLTKSFYESNMHEQNIRLNFPKSTGFNSDFSRAQRQAGSIDGMAVSARTIEDDVDEQIEISYLRQNLGLDAARTNLLLKQMKLEVRDKAQDFGAKVIHQYLRTMGGSKGSAELSQEILRRMMKGLSLPQTGNSQKEITAKAIALYRLSEALHDNDDGFVAWLSPLKPETSDLTDLARKLQDAGEDAHEIRSQLSDFRGLPEEDEELTKSFGSARFDLSQLKNVLRNMQQLPHLDQETRQNIAEQVKDEINELHRQHGTHLLALRNLLENAGDLASEELAQSYDELVHGESSSFTGAMEILVLRHESKTLIGTVIPIIEKTLSHELSLNEDQRSVDKEKLHAILSEFQHIHILKTLIERLEGFLASMGRLYGLGTC